MESSQRGLSFHFLNQIKSTIVRQGATTAKRPGERGSDRAAHMELTEKGNSRESRAKYITCYALRSV